MSKLLSNNKPMVLIVDDEPGICELLTEILRDEGYQTTTAYNGEEAHRSRVEKEPNIILLDIWMPDIDGISLIRKWKEDGLMGPPIIVMSGHATVDTAVEATQLGAASFLEKPISADRLLAAVKKATTTPANPLFNPIIQDANFGKSEAMKSLKDQLLRASALPDNLLFTGSLESGMSFFAGMLTPPGKIMQSFSSERDVAIDPMKTLKNVAGGVLFVPNLDMMENTELRSVYLLASKALQTKVRVVAHSSLDREGLGRLGGVEDRLLDQFHETVIRIPPFSEFVSDIPELAVLISKQLVIHNEVSAKTLSTSAVNVLRNHPWENNFSKFVKTIRNAMHFSVVEEIDEAVVRSVISQSHPHEISQTSDQMIYDKPLREAREIFEREYFKRLLSNTGGNIVEAAQKAGLERTYLYRKLKHLDLDEVEADY